MFSTSQVELVIKGKENSITVTRVDTSHPFNVTHTRSHTSCIAWRPSGGWQKWKQQTANNFHQPFPCFSGDGQWHVLLQKHTHRHTHAPCQITVTFAVMCRQMLFSSLVLWRICCSLREMTNMKAIKSDCDLIRSSEHWLGLSNIFFPPRRPYLLR